MWYVYFSRARQRIVLLTLIGLAVVVSLGGTPVHAQGPRADEDVSLEEQMNAGIHAFQDNRLARAESLFAEVFGAKPSYISPRHGAAAYWLGTAYQQQEAVEQARRTWIKGQRAVAAADAFDVRLADAYLRALFATGLTKQRLEAADAYLQLLSHADSSLASAEAEIVRQHAAQSALLMADEQQRRLSDGSVHDESWTLKDGTGAYLVAWWNRQDSAPATPENERLEEHLERVAQARSEYATDERVSGLDDRGETYVRYGPPYLQRSITYNDAGFFLDVFRFGVNVSGFDFPDNEIWTYPQIHHAAYFLFIEKDGLFQIGDSADLMPSRLQSTFSNSERHLNRAVSALAAMQYIFRDLALYHSDFGTLYNEVADYANWQEMNAMTYKMTGEPPPGTTMRKVGAGIGQQRFVFSSPTMGIGMPSEFVQRTVSQQQTIDYHAQRVRRQVMPPQYSELFDGVDSLSLAVRTARFLEPGGKTRTEVYWGTLARNLQLREEDADKGTLVKLTAVQYDQDYDRHATDDKWYNTGSAEGAEGIVVPSVFEVWSTADVYHLGLQWEQYTADVSGPHIQLGKQIRLATHRVDTLAALSTEDHQLEMSDLKPMLPEENVGLGSTADDRAAPYPFDRIAPDASLLLYFELYHLGFSGDDRTRYTVEYDVLRRTERGRIARLFRGDDEQRTTASTTYEGDSRTAREQILIDLSDWENDKEGVLTVTVRVTDETTGQQVERAITFDIARTS